MYSEVSANTRDYTYIVRTYIKVRPLPPRHFSKLPIFRIWRLLIFQYDLTEWDGSFPAYKIFTKI